MLNGDCMAKTSPALVVADAGPLIHLDELAALDVLSDYAAVLVPNTVGLEVQHHRPQALQQTNVKLIRQLSPAPSDGVNAMTALTPCIMANVRHWLCVLPIQLTC